MRFVIIPLSNAAWNTCPRRPVTNIVVFYVYAHASSSSRVLKILCAHVACVIIMYRDNLLGKCIDGVAGALRWPQRRELTEL